MKLLVVTALLAQVLIPSVLARDYRYCEGNKYNLPSGLSCREQDPTWTSFCNSARKNRTRSGTSIEENVPNRGLKRTVAKQQLTGATPAIVLKLSVARHSSRTKSPHPLRRNK
ncbi:predicted protein [Plenodomus lingam JN3]|uniref:Predicted protein n=1 Tax=Leptosphaeria maculans (strain JN3 / isolate v23.1.3 / race Av1-4-5-6-7-8) TaxID=985895 RepID=E4ZSK3_LEPMJ|nr:predicted protein [Plenodomus lingam JN3]CBX94383.1 predicted protein [Plenodomus lingam JN3]